MAKLYSMQPCQSSVSVSFVETFVLITSTRERNGFNITELLQIELFLKLLSTTVRKSRFPTFIFHWMRHYIPQKLMSPFVNTKKANPENTAYYSEASKALNHHIIYLFISSLCWKTSWRIRWTLSTINWWYCKVPSYQFEVIMTCKVVAFFCYTSLDISNSLLEKKMTIVGTINSNRKGVSALKANNDRVNQSTKVFLGKKSSMNTSCVVNTKSSGKRNGLLLSTTIRSCNERSRKAETSHHQVLQLHQTRNRHCWSEN